MMDDFRRWSEALVGGLGGDLDLERSRAEIGEMFLFFSDAVERRRREPGEDLISAIAVAEPDGRQLQPIEVVMFCILLLVAGNETTTNLIGNHQEALWDHPDQAALLRERPELVDAAIEEALRYCGTVQGLFRRTTQACAIGGVGLPTDADVLVLFAAANRDETVFRDADRYWLERPNLDHVAFGHGIHYCLGAQLARLEVRAVLEALLRAGVDLQPAGTPRRTMNPVLRGFTQLPVGATR